MNSSLRIDNFPFSYKFLDIPLLFSYHQGRNLHGGGYEEETPPKLHDGLLTLGLLSLAFCIAMAVGMAGIFIVIGVIILITMALNKFTKK